MHRSSMGPPEDETSCAVYSTTAPLEYQTTCDDVKNLTHVDSMSILIIILKLKAPFKITKNQIGCSLDGDTTHALI